MLSGTPLSWNSLCQLPHSRNSAPACLSRLPHDHDCMPSMRPHLQAITLVLQSLQARQSLVPQLQQAGVGVVLHYIPVHHISAVLEACRQPGRNRCAAS